MNEPFAGDKKKGQSILGPVERRFIDWGVPKIPARIMTQHLTLFTIVWVVAIVFAGWMAVDHRWWLHVISFCVAGQWLTDAFDGSLGKYREQGLVKWGFFMDHILDLLFAGSIVIAYSFLVEASWLKFLFYVLLLITCATMAVSFLSFAATNQFQIAYYGFGPTEVRIGYIAINTFVYFAGTELFTWGVPVILGLNVAAFALMTIQSSRTLWQLDYEANVHNHPRP